MIKKIEQLKEEILALIDDKTNWTSFDKFFEIDICVMCTGWMGVNNKMEHEEDCLIAKLRVILAG